MVRSAPTVFGQDRNEVTLTYLDPKKDTILQVDASMKGLGAAFTQDRKLVAFVSKALTDLEARYANTERELLVVAYGSEKVHTYLYGRSFTVYTDHKPLESIPLKHLTAAPLRLQRILLRLQPYDLTIRYCPGKDMEPADAHQDHQDPISEMNVQINAILAQISNKMLLRADHLRRGTHCT